MQRLADLIGSTVDRPQIKETTALGAAYLAGFHAGFFPEPDRFIDHWRLERRFHAANGLSATRERKLAGWTSGRAPFADAEVSAITLIAVQCGNCLRARNHMPELLQELGSLRSVVAALGVGVLVLDMMKCAAFAAR